MGPASFLNSIPQVSVYGLTIQEMTGIEVECIIVNSEGAWSFDPN